MVLYYDQSLHCSIVNNCFQENLLKYIFIEILLWELDKKSYIVQINKSIWPKQKIQIQSKILMNYADHANTDATSNATWDKIPFLIQILHQPHSNKDHPPESDVPGLQYEWQTLFHLLNAWFVLTHLSNKLIKYSQKSLTILHFNG